MDRPIKFNPTGQYNLNFVDWINEFERIIEDDELEYYIEIDRQNNPQAYEEELDDSYSNG